MFRNFAFYVAIYLIGAGLVTAWIYTDAFETALNDDRNAGTVRISEAAIRLRGQTDLYRALVNIIAQTPNTIRTLQFGSDSGLGNQLTQLKLTYGASHIDLVKLDGNVVWSSSSQRTGHRYSPSLLGAALNGRLGNELAIENGERLIRFSRRVTNAASLPVGIVVVSVSLEELEFEWPFIPEPIVFYDGRGVSMSSNRSDLVLLSKYEYPEFDRFPLDEVSSITSAVLWTFSPRDGTPLEVQSLSMDVPQLKMSGQILLTTKEARATALLRMGLAIALLVALALVGAIIIQQRRRIEMESRHSATLENRVSERTAELRATQDELVEASNLAALGRLSAGVSHELNQPLAAILNFAENGRREI